MNKILIVDDEINNRILLEEILENFEDAGVRLLYAANGIDALDIIRYEKPELVFLDIMLPEMNGFDVCRTVKHEPGLNNVFIAVLSAKGQDTDKEKAAEARADMYITKPFKSRVIVDVVQKVLNSAVEI